ncbi:MAG: zinc ribbon domain-containing protein [Lachnospiraceae bacterium]|nr:zinc ribbon domain-containing protein [Lachnospiraceae bacterium]
MKRSVTENYYDNCPNCGAVIQPDYKVCPYCGTTVVHSRTYTESDETQDIYNINTQNVYYYNDEKQNPGDSRKVDFISTADPDNGGVANTVGGVVFLVVWTGICIAMSVAFFADAGLMGLMPVGMGVVGVVGIVSILKKSSAYNGARYSAPHYDAEVIGHSKYSEERGSGDDARLRTTCSVKVLATIDGREQCILIESKNPAADALYPVGCHITIAGSGTNFVIIE